MLIRSRKTWRHNKLEDTRVFIVRILFETEKRQEADAAQQEKEENKKVYYTLKKDAH